MRFRMTIQRQMVAVAILAIVIAFGVIIVPDLYRRVRKCQEIAANMPVDSGAGGDKQWAYRYAWLCPWRLYTLDLDRD